MVSGTFCDVRMGVPLAVEIKGETWEGAKPCNGARTTARVKMRTVCPLLRKPGAKYT